MEVLLLVGGSQGRSTHADPISARKNGNMRKPDEQAVLDDARDGGKPIRQSLRIGNPPERSIAESSAPDP